MLREREGERERLLQYVLVRRSIPHVSQHWRRAVEGCSAKREEPCHGFEDPFQPPQPKASKPKSQA